MDKHLKWDNVFKVLLSLVFFIMPFGKHLLTNVTILAFLIGCLSAFRRKDYRKALQNPIWWVYVIFFIWQVISLLWSSNISEGFGQIQIKLGLFILPFFILAAGSILTLKSFNKILNWFIIGCTATLSGCFISSTIKTIQIGTHMRLSSGGTYTQNLFTYQALAEDFMHPGYLATYLGIAIILMIVQTIQQQKKKHWWRFLLIAYLFMGMLMLQGRINLLALFVILGIAALVYAFKKKAFYVLGFVALPLALLLTFMLIAPSNLKERYFQLPDFSYDISGNNFNSATYRLAEWTCAADVISKTPFIGTGVGDNREALIEAYKKRNFKQGVLNRFNAHNQFIETTISTGFIGLLFLLAVFAVFISLAIKKQNYLLLLSVLFFGLCLLTESMLERAWAVTLMASVFPFLASLNSSESVVYRKKYGNVL